MRIVPTPIASTVPWPAELPGGFDARLLPALIDGPGQEALRARLAVPDVLVVTTGQQPALCTGPLYAVHKALSAAALAQILAARWKRPVVPLFWVAGDDHDFAEANHAAWLGADGSLHVETLPDRPAAAALRPMSREPLGAGVTAALAVLNTDLAQFENHEPVLAWLRRHYRPDATLAAASGGALAELLAPLGVLCLDGTHPALKAQAAPVIRRALEDAAGLESALVGRAGELRAAGRDPGVVVGDGATLVMLENGLGRDRLILRNGGFVTRHGGERHTLDELVGMLAAEPTRFSAECPSPAGHRERPAADGGLRRRARRTALPRARGGALRAARRVTAAAGAEVVGNAGRTAGRPGAREVRRVAGGAARARRPLEARVAREHLPAAALAAIAALRPTPLGSTPRSKPSRPTSIRPCSGRSRGFEAVPSAAWTRRRRSWCSTSSGGSRPN